MDLARAMTAALSALALAAALALATLGCGADRPAADEPTAHPPAGASLTLNAMLSPAGCFELPVRQARAAGQLPHLGVLARTQREADLIPPPRGNVVTWLPVSTFDPAETRLAGAGVLPTAVHVVPTLGVPAEDRCGSARGPGICLVAGGPEFRCFSSGEIDAGRALALTADGFVVGIVRDGIERVVLSTGAASATVQVVENVFAVRLASGAGSRIDAAVVPAGRCSRAVAPELRARIALLEQEAPAGVALPSAAREVLREWEWQLDAVVDEAARRWGGGDGVEYWAVPVVPRRQPPCAPASRICIVAVPAEARADAQCALDRVGDGTSWRLAPLLPTRAAIYGIVPDGVSGAQVTIGRHTAKIAAHDNVIGGVLPFAYQDEAATRVVLERGRPF